MSEQKEVAVREPSKGATAVMQQLKTGGPIAPVIPRDVDETYRLAKAIVMAGLAPASYEMDGPSREPDPQKIMIGIMKGLEVGLPPITALSTIAIINKRPSIWGDGAVALCQQSGQVEWVKTRWEGTEDQDDWTAIFEIKRRNQDEPYVGKFSVLQARRAKLWANPKKIPWIQYPGRMLLARARAYALREGFADCLAGLSIAEEIQDLPAEPEKVSTDFLDDGSEGGATVDLETVAEVVEENAVPHAHEDIFQTARDVASLGLEALTKHLGSLPKETLEALEPIESELASIAEEADKGRTGTDNGANQ